MPYKDPGRQRAAQRDWIASRRAHYLAGKSCVDCGASTQLEIDHRDPGSKHSHRIWSWTADRLAAELVKCDIRCRSCHTERHAAARRRHGLGGYKRGCRCDLCREAKRVAAAIYRMRRKLREVEERRRRDLHSRPRLCRPVPNSSATAPDHLEGYAQAASDGCAEAA